MLSDEQFIEHYRRHRDTAVLSVYVDAGQTDPAARSAWHIRLTEELRRLQNEVAAEQQTDLEAAASRILDALGPPDRFLKGRGWVGFATPDELIFAEGLPVPMPDLVRWERGIRAAPYVRALKQSRAVAAAVLDARRARVLQYQLGVLDERDALSADDDLGDLTDATTSKRGRTRTGVRGATGKDTAQKLLDRAADQLVDRTAAALLEIARTDGTIVIGGTRDAVAKLERALSARADGRVVVRPRLSFDLSDSEIQAEVEAAASEASREKHAGRVAAVVDLARSGGAACLGLEETTRAVLERRVKQLFLSDSFQQRDPDLADRLVGSAFEGGSTAVEVAGDAARTLDSEAGGVGAFLHYRVQAPGAAPADT